MGFNSFGFIQVAEQLHADFAFCCTEGGLGVGELELPAPEFGGIFSVQSFRAGQLDYWEFRMGKFFVDIASQSHSY